MNPHIKIHVTAGTLAAMSDEQFAALRQNVLAEGQWDSAKGLRLSGGGDYLGVEPMSSSLRGSSVPLMFIGIERDGYTHS